MENQYEAQRNQVRAAVRGVYDLQKLRIQNGARLVATFKAKLGIEPGVAEEDVEDSKAQEILKELRSNYDLITEAVIKEGKTIRQRGFKGQGLISNYAEFALTRTYMQLDDAETEAFKDLKAIIAGHPVMPFLGSVKGCGVAMSAIIISEFDIHRSKYVSSLWKYAGLDVVVKENGNGDLVGVGRSRQKDQMGEVEYTNSEGETATRKTLGYNPWLKTKLIGVLATCMIKAGGEYATIYRNYKHRLENDPRHVEKTKAHRHNMAMRYMIKVFLQHLYAYWRAAEGLEVHTPYHEGKLGIVHTASN